MAKELCNTRVSTPSGNVMFDVLASEVLNRTKSSELRGYSLMRYTRLRYVKTGEKLHIPQREFMRRLKENKFVLWSKISAKYHQVSGNDIGRVATADGELLP